MKIKRNNLALICLGILFAGFILQAETMDILKNPVLEIKRVLNAINIASNGFNTSPRKMLIVQMGEYRADLLLVSPPSNDGRKVEKTH